MPVSATERTREPVKSSGTSTESGVRAWLRIARRGLPLLTIGFLVDAAFLLVFLVILQTYLPESLGASPAIAGYALATFGAAKLISQLGGGVVSDVLGMRRTLIAGTALHLAGNIAILPLAHVAPWLVVGAAVLYGLGSSLTWPPIYSLVAACFEEHERARLSSALTLVTALALVLGLGGGALTNLLLSFDVAMLVPIATAAVALAIAVSTRVSGEEECRRAQQGMPSISELPRVIRSLPQLTFSLMVLTESSALGALSAVYRAYGRDVVGVTLIHEALLLAPAAALGAASVPVGGAAADRYGRRPFLLGGFGVSGACLLLLARWNDPALVLVVAAVAGASFGLAVPSMGATMMALAGAARARGGVIGWFMTADGLGQSIGPALAGLLVGASGAAAVLLMVGILFIALALMASASPLGGTAVAPAHADLVGAP